MVGEGTGALDLGSVGIAAAMLEHLGHAEPP